jgi:hypothetical protein
MNATKDWKAVGESIEGLALKLKLHCEQNEAAATEDLQLAIQAAGDGIETAFDSLKAAVADDAVKQDVKDVAAGLRDAVANTLAELAARTSSKGA